MLIKGIKLKLNWTTETKSNRGNRSCKSILKIKDD